VYPPHYPHIAALKEEIGRWRFYYLEPSSMRQEVPLKVATDIGKNGRDLAAFLHTVKKRNEEHFASIERTLCTLLPAIEGLDVTRSPDGQLHLWVQEGDAEYSASVISEGTLRVLGLIAVASTHSDATVCGYEEPENGVHPSRLRVVARLLQGIVDNGRQIITTTHSPDLPDYLQDEDLVICYKDGEGSHFEQFVGAPTGLFRKSALLSALDGDLLDRALRNTERSAEHQGVS
jgi:predicted ATPase